MRASFVEPGALRAELFLQEAELEPDGAGGHRRNWGEVASLLAHVEPVSQRAFFGADQRIESVTHRITMRWRSDTVPGMRFRRRDRHFDILTVHDPDETGRYLVCMAREDRP